MKEKILILLLLLTLVNSTCKNSGEDDGKCSECAAGYALADGYCVTKMRGCLVHEPDSRCKECQFGYVLSVGQCIRQAIFYGYTDLTPAPLVPYPTKYLTFEEIENKLGKIYGPYFSNIHQFFLGKYSQLGKGQITNVQTVETKYGVYLRIQYSQNGKIYTAEASMDIFNNIKEISFVEGKSSTGVIPFIYKIQKTQTQVKAYFVYEIIVQEQEFIVDFMGKNNDVVRFTAQRSDNDELDYQVFNIPFISLAKEKALNQYPELQQKKLFSLQNSGFIVFIASDQTISLSLIFQNYRFLINHPVRSTITEGSLISGNFTVFSEYEDPRYLSALDYLKKQFPEIANATIVQAKSQIVSGINFLFSLLEEETAARYILKVFHDFRGVNQLIEGYKNGRLIYKLEHDYNKDQSFLAYYLQAAEKTKVLNIPPIASVSKKTTDASYFYRVNYNFEEFLEFSLNIVENEVKEVVVYGYKVGGQNLNELSSSLLERSSRRSPNVLINFFKSEKPIVIGEKIKQITYNEPFYTIIITLPTGTYKAVIEDKGQLFLISYIKLDETTCFDLSSAQIQSDDVVSAVDTFLKAHYPIKQFTIQSIQVKVFEGRYEYRYLYANNRLKQVQFYLQEKDSQISVLKAAILDFGYEIVDQIVDGELFQKLNSAIVNLDIGLGTPLYTEKNSTYIRSYFSGDKDTVQALFSTKQMAIKISNTIATRNYLLLPEGFQFKGLKVPSVAGEEPTDAEIKEITQIVNEAANKYKLFIINPEVKFAQKLNEGGYLILTKTDKGYIQFKGSITYQPAVEGQQSIVKSFIIGNVVITNYELSDFSSCRKYSVDGKCLECSEKQFPYQGSCFKQMDGCLIQLGNQCVKCDTNFAKSQFRCYKECKLFFA